MNDDDPLPAISLLNWPLRDEPQLAIPTLVMIIVLASIVGWMAGPTWWGYVALGSLLIASWRMWIPVRYELDARGIQQFVCGRRVWVPWDRIECFEVDRAGVWLAKRNATFPRSSGRGIYVRGNACLLQLQQTVECFVASGGEESSR